MEGSPRPTGTTATQGLAELTAVMRPLQAQTDAAIFKIGQRLTLTYVGDRVVECNVAEIRSTFIRCEDNKIMWFNTATTIALTVR